MYLYIYLFLAVLGLSCCLGFSLVVSCGLLTAVASLVEGRGLLIAVASPVAKHGF